MPRDSPYAIELSKVERARLEFRARKYTSPYRDVIRAKIILLAAQGLSNDIIATMSLPSPSAPISQTAPNNWHFWRELFMGGVTKVGSMIYENGWGTGGIREGVICLPISVAAYRLVKSLA